VIKERDREESKHNINTIIIKEDNNK